MKEYLQLIVNKPLAEQIDILENYLPQCRTSNDILAVGKLIREKKWLTKQPPEQTIIEPSPPMPSPAEENAARIAYLSKKLRLYLLHEQWEEAQQLLRKIIDECYDFSPEEFAFLESAWQKLKEQQQKCIPPPKPDERQIELGKLSILITDGNWVEARKIANKLILESGDFWISPETEKFKTLLAELKKLEVSNAENRNLPARITALEEEKEMLQKENQKLIIVQQQASTEAFQATEFLKRLDVLLCDPGNLAESRELATHLQSKYLHFLTPEQTDVFKRLIQVLKDQETEQRRQQDLSVEIEKLQQKLADYRQKCGEIEQKCQMTMQEKESLQTATLSLKQAQCEIEHLKKLAATVVAYIYVDNKGVLKSERKISFLLNEYLENSSPYANPGHPASVRDAILRRFQDCFEPYEKLMHEDNLQ